MIRLQEYTLEELRKDIRREMSTICEQELQTENKGFRRCTSIGHEGNIFKICCINGQLMLHFRKVITISLLFALMFQAEKIDLYMEITFFISIHSYLPTIGSPYFGLSLRVLMSYIYIYGVHILDVSRSHTTTHHSR
jgi:hypothetical protein